MRITHCDADDSATLAYCGAEDSPTLAYCGAGADDSATLAYRYVHSMLGGREPTIPIVYPPTRHGIPFTYSLLCEAL
jgi:hypothetical protein